MLSTLLIVIILLVLLGGGGGWYGYRAGWYTRPGATGPGLYNPMGIIWFIIVVILIIWLVRELRVF
jgi:hypothetical protein